MQTRVPILVLLICLTVGCALHQEAARTSQTGPQTLPSKTTGQQRVQTVPTKTANNGSELYKVIRVIDGDTIVINYKGVKEKVRFIGVNTPEIHHPVKKVEPFGLEAASYTKKLLQDKYIRLEFDVQQRDKYGRLLGYIYLSDGTFINARLVAEGYAQVMTVPPDVKCADEFIYLQRQARLAGKGLWGIKSKTEKD